MVYGTFFCLQPGNHLSVFPDWMWCSWLVYPRPEQRPCDAQHELMQLCPRVGKNMSLLEKVIAHKGLVKCHLADSPVKWQTFFGPFLKYTVYFCSVCFCLTSLWCLSVSWLHYRTSVWTLVTVLRLQYTPAVACSPQLISCPPFGLRTGSLCSACW